VPQNHVERIAALIGVAAILVLAAAAMVAHGSGQTTAPRRGTKAATKSLTQRVATAQTTTAANASVASAAHVQLTASRGECWMSIRDGAPNGQLLFEGVLAEGKSVAFTRTRIWLRLGAAANVDLTLGGRRVSGLPLGTIDLVATHAGVVPTANL
jgi:hypothetical protein